MHVQVESRGAVSEGSEGHGQQGVAGAAALHCAGLHLQRPLGRPVQCSAQAPAQGERKTASPHFTHHCATSPVLASKAQLQPPLAAILLQQRHGIALTEAVELTPVMRGPMPLLSTVLEVCLGSACASDILLPAGAGVKAPESPAHHGGCSAGSRHHCDHDPAQLDLWHVRGGARVAGEWIRHHLPLPRWYASSLLRPAEC